MNRAFLFLAVFLVSTGTAAACPTKAPSDSKYNIHSDDHRVNAAWLTKTLSGKRLALPRGVEIYNTDGTYNFKTKSQTQSAKSYKFYNNGIRCIDYPNPRFDLYVVNNGTLVLISGGGGRIAGRLME